jgi:hypothetical protein
MLADVTNSLKASVQPILTIVGPISISTRWPKLVKNVQYTSLPSYTPTRWYSLWKLVRNAVTLCEEIQHFLESDQNRKWAPIPDDAWRTAETLGPVLTTFRNAMLLLERDNFGSRAHGLEALQMIDLAIMRQGHSCPEIIAAWNAAKQHWTKYISGSHKTLLLMCVLPNPGVLVKNFLPAGGYSLACTTLEKEYALMKTHLPGPARQYSQSRPPRKWSRGTRDELLGIGTDERDELTDFCQLDRLPNVRQKSFDAAIWWESRREDLPILYELVKKYLVVPATSAAVERQFSRAKRIQSDSSGSLGVERFQSMTVLARNLDVVASVTERTRTIEPPQHEYDDGADEEDSQRSGQGAACDRGHPSQAPAILARWG